MEQEINKSEKDYFRLEYTNDKNQDCLPDVSIISPTYNRKENLRNMLLSLSYQSYPFNKFEVIIIDDGSNDGTDRMIKSLVLPFSYKYFWQNDLGRRVGRARNIGIRQAQGEIILFIDSDAICTVNLVKRHMEKHCKAKNIMLLGGMFELAKNETVNIEKLLQKTISRLRFYIHTVKKRRLVYLSETGKAELSTFFCSMNASVGRDNLLAVNCFDEDFDGIWADEDVELGYRLGLKGLKMDFDPEAVVYHQCHPIDTTALFASRNHLLLFIKHPELLSHTVICNRKNKYYAYSIEEIKSLLEKANRHEIKFKITIFGKIERKLWLLLYLLIPGMVLIIKDKLNDGFGRYWKKPVKK